MQNLLEALTKTLSQDERLVANGRLKKNKVQELARNMDAALIKLLLGNKTPRKHFFREVDGVWVFDKAAFLQFVDSKEFLPDSYTAFKNRTGLTADGRYLSTAREVVLSWPYKDCVLEGGQIREDKGRKEVFINETLAPDAIDRLFEPKLFTNWQRYDSKGTHRVKHLSAADNFLVKGNNLLALHSLKKNYRGRIRQIYIDPPYNTGNDAFQYNDSFNHSTWLTFMKNRIEAARTLLAENGSLWMNIDDGESHYLKVLCDEIFGRENFIVNFIWQKKYAPANDARFFSDNHDHILVYAKNKTQFKPNLLQRTDDMNKRYINRDNDPRGPWKPGGFSVKTYSKEYDYPIETPSGKVVYPPEGGCWQTSKENYLKKLADNRIWFGKNGDSKPQLKQFLSEVQQGMVARSIWLYDEVGHNQVAHSEMLAYFGEYRFSTPKPERLLKRILELGSNKGDIVLDFFAGSGTTLAVAMKMQRRFIGIEQMDYIYTVTAVKLRRVTEGLKTGISEETGWKGGGSFVFAELMPFNKQLKDRVMAATDRSALRNLAEEVFAHPSLHYQVSSEVIQRFKASFEDAALSHIKGFLIEILDRNMAYVPFSEARNSDFHANKTDIRLTKEFYHL